MSFGGGGNSNFTFGQSANAFGNSGGGFGSTNNNSGGFGGQSTTSPFGGNNNNTSGSIFGASANTSTGGFGGGFGNNNNNNAPAGGSLFGAKPATPFGGTTNNTGSLFGGSTTTPTTNTAFGSNNSFGGLSGTTFGSGGNNTASGFGAFGNNNNNSTGGLFGSSAAKPLFGAGGTGTTSGFGASNNAFGGNTAGVVGPAPGTDKVPFNPFVEKEANGTTCRYETITFQDPYKPYSLEELRLADYNSGHQFGNASGQTGAFGQTNFGNSTFTGNAGGFGSNTGGSLFGGNNATTSSTGFGSTTATTGGFGSNNTGGGLFGSANQNKPGGLFGQASTAAPAGGLFGTSNNNANTTSTFGGFGSNANTTSGGLFGNANANQTQNKPGGLFGSTANTTGNTGGGFSFGNSTNNQTNTTGGLFGNNNAATTTNTTGGLFGSNTNNQQQAGSTGGLFGSQNQTSGGLFGAKPAATGFGTSTTQTQGGGLFGNNTSNTGGGLFGQNQATQNNTGGGLFGNNNTANTGGGLFGNQTQNKPGGLFGNTATTNTGGGLFGGNNTNNNSGGLFNNNANNNNNQQSTGLFGTTSTNTGGGLFGGAQNNQNKGGLFGGNTSTNNQGSSMFGNSMNTGGLFGQSQNNQQNPQQQEVKHASLLDPNPYGQSSIWTSLPQPTAENSQPLFTPLTATKKMQESAMKPLPSLRLNQSRYNTPPRRNGFGFSYSTYGTPSSATSTPGGASLSGSMYGNRSLSGGSFGRSFNRSASVQNLRSYYASDSDDVWKPNAFAPSHRNSSGSIKRLTIDRSIRQDLFNRPQLPALPAPKSSSNGDNSPANTVIADGNAEPPRKLNKRVSFENTVQETTLNGTNGALVRTEQDSDEETTPPRGTNGTAENARGNELQAVPEDRESHQVSSKPAKATPKADQAPGAYWMKPSRQEIAKMPREQRRDFRNFQVGRNGCGFINFDGKVDLESVNLDDVFGNIVNLEVRSATVYPDPSTKPMVGKGLNVPSTIELENSWPRNKGQLSSETSGRHYEQHIRRLKKMEGTEFINYDSSRGIWKFKVPHYTTYGLDYDDDEGMDQSELSLPPTSLENSADASEMEVDDHTDSNDEDDTFAFKRSLPGQFSKNSMIIEDTELPSDDTQDQPQYDDGSDRSMISEEDMMSDEDQSSHMPGSLPQPPAEFSSPVRAPIKPAALGTPGKPLLDLEGDWAEQLQRTISPRKQNRDLLREAQSKVLLDKNFSPLKPKAAPQVNFRSSMDIMNSIFLPAGGKKGNKAAEPDFEFPYSKRSKTFHPTGEDMTESDRQWHESFKPHFTNSGKMLYKTSRGGGTSWLETTLARDHNSTLVLGQHKDQKTYDLASALTSCEIKPFVDLVPRVKHKKVPFSRLLSQLNDADQSVVDVYRLAHVLFDDYEDDFTHGLTKPLQKKFKDRIRKDRLRQFLVSHISEDVNQEVDSLKQSDPLRAVVLLLVANDVKGACQILKDQNSIRLMLAVSQLDSADVAFMDAARDQIDAWRTQKSLSEFNLDIRALYEICAGNVTVCRGNEGKGVPVEDRAETFIISQRYKLDWLQSFALGFFYGRVDTASKTGMSNIEDVVLAFKNRCDAGEEPQKPAENDAMWALLQYYAASIVSDDDDQDQVPHPPFPECIGNLAKPWDHSDLFNFYHAMAANTTFVENFLSEDDVVKLDQLAELLSSELCAKGDVASAIYALIHIDDANTRKVLIQDLLDRFAAGLPGPDMATSNAGIELWTRLTMDLKVPQSWLYMSKARYAASATNNGGDNISELRYLVAAEAWDPAHDCLLKRVAPSFTIDEDWAGLLEMCGLFGDDPARKIATWYDGGAVYETFANLITGQIGKDDTETITDLRKKLVTLGSRNAKARVQLGRLGNHEREEHVAVKEMANGLARLAMQGGNVGTVKEILELPITQDVRADVAMCLGAEDYEVIAGVGSGKEVGKGRATRGRRGVGAVQTGVDSEMIDDDGHGGDPTA